MTNSVKQNRLIGDISNMDCGKNLANVARGVADIFGELLRGIMTNTIPWIHCASIGTLLCLIMIGGIDFRALQAAGLSFLYPTTSPAYQIYYVFIALSPFFGWSVLQVALKRKLLKRLTGVFESAGLKNNLGKLPGFIFDRPLDANTRILRLSRANLPKSKFVAARESLEAALQVHVDEIRESIANGTIDIIYAHDPMPDLVKLEATKLGTDQFVVGATRSGEIRMSLEDVPHLLVAGQTGGGKSSFLRQLITSLYVSNKEHQFTLVDLKGGLEFQMFENLTRTKVLSDIRRTVSELTSFEKELDRRYEILKKLGCKDLEAYRKLPEERRKGSPSLARHIIVIDEVAELFLAGSTMPPKDAQSVRRACSKVARQGRAVGIHLIACTQRPDARALDTQIKGQLTGKICFQMGDTASSMVVLSNKRARDLPSTPGRAIWQSGMKQVEVQVPFLSTDDAEQTLKPFLKKGKEGTAKATDNVEPPAPTTSEPILEGMA